MNKRTKSTISLLLALLFVATPFLVYPASAESQVIYNLEGTWEWNYYLGEGVYTHIMTIDSYNPITGVFSGTGYYVANPSYTWDLTGTVEITEEGINVNFLIDYTGSNPTYYVQAEGELGPYGLTMSGTATGGNQLPPTDQTGATWNAIKDEESIILLDFPEGSTAVASVEVILEGDLPPCIPPLPEGLTPYIDVQIISGSFEGTVRVCVRYDDSEMTPEEEMNLRLYMGDCVDFNLDGTINGKDLSLIKKGIRNDQDYSPWNVYFDVNNDGEVDDIDVDIVKEYMTKGLIVNQGRNGMSQARLPWLDITVSVDTDLNIICGETDHFSIFRGR